MLTVSFGSFNKPTSHRLLFLYGITLFNRGMSSEEWDLGCHWLGRGVETPTGSNISCRLGQRGAPKWPGCVPGHDKGCWPHRIMHQKTVQFHHGTNGLFFRATGWGSIEEVLSSGQKGCKVITCLTLCCKIWNKWIPKKVSSIGWSRGSDLQPCSTLCNKPDSPATHFDFFSPPAAWQGEADAEKTQDFRRKSDFPWVYHYSLLALLVFLAAISSSHPCSTLPPFPSCTRSCHSRRFK